MSNSTTASQLQNIVSVCHLLARNKMVSATDGNVSVRATGGTFFTTRSSVHKGDVTIGDIVEVDRSGKLISGTGKPSTEIKMHLLIYERRPDINAVIHAHPIFATAFAAAGHALDRPVFPEVLVMLGKIPLAPYATPSTDEIPDSIKPFVDDHDAILLANHGAVTYGKDLQQAYFGMEKLEHAAQITLYARMLGGEQLLSGEQIRKLIEVSEQSYGKKIHYDPANIGHRTRQFTETDVYEILKRVLQRVGENR
jgi:L-fuculose-phosphate aldolase